MLTEIENKMDSEQNESSNDNYISSTSLNQTLDSNCKFYIVSVI